MICHRENKCVRADKLEFNNGAFVQAEDKPTIKTSGGGARNGFNKKERPQVTEETLLFVAVKHLLIPDVFFRCWVVVLLLVG